MNLMLKGFCKNIELGEGTGRLSVLFALVVEFLTVETVLIVEVAEPEVLFEVVVPVVFALVEPVWTVVVTVALVFVVFDCFEELCLEVQLAWTYFN